MPRGVKAADRIVRLPFPVRGLIRRFAYEDKPDQGTEDALNVRPSGPLEARARGGSRPGIGRAFTEHIGGFTITGVSKSAGSNVQCTCASGETPREVGDVVGIEGALGATEINGVWRVAARTATTFDLEATENLSIGTYTADSATWGAPVMMLESVNFIPTDQRDEITDNFDVEVFGVTYTIYESGGLPWATPAFEPGIATKRLVSPGFQWYVGPRVEVAGSQVRGGVLESLDINTASAYRVELYTTPFPFPNDDEYGHYNGKYRLYLGLSANSQAAATEGIIVELVVGDDIGTFSGSIMEFDGVGSTWASQPYDAGSPSATTNFDTTRSPLGNSPAAWFRAILNGTTLDVYWGDVLLKSMTLSFTPTSTPMVGFGVESTNQTAMYASTFRCQWISNSQRSDQRQTIVAAANGRVYQENPLGTLILAGLTANQRLSHNQPLQAAEYSQKLYIADHEPPLVEDTLENGIMKASPNGDQLDDTITPVSDWTAVIPDSDDAIANYVCVLSGTDPNMPLDDGTYRGYQTIQLSAVAADFVTLAEKAHNHGSSVSTAYSIQRAPKIYDPVADTFEIWQTEEITQADSDDGYTGTVGARKGQVPTGCHIIARFLDRLVLAKDNQWFMSRAGNPRDFNYLQADNDVNRAISAANAPAGTIGQPITALAAYGDDHLLMSARTELYVMRGNPAFGGRIDNLSYKVGVIGQFAWTHGPSGEVYFLSNDGLYMQQRGAREPQSLSREPLPNALLNVDTSRYHVFLQYDMNERGVSIFITPKDLGRGLHYWWDGQTQSIWPLEFGYDAGMDVDWGRFEPYSVFTRTSQGASNDIALIGTRGGSVRFFEEGRERDGDFTFDSHVWIGPFFPGEHLYYEGLCKTLQAILANNSGDITWSLYGAETPETALTAAIPKQTGLWSSGLNKRVQTRFRGGAFYLKLEAATGKRPWAFEEVRAVLRTGGRQRLLT